jgi:hypothetical protein
MLIITYDVSGLESFERKMELAMRDLHDRRKPHVTARDYMKRRWAVNFDSQGSIYGKWRPMAAFTIMWHGPGTLLNRTGKLRSGFMAQAASPTQLTNDATVWEFVKNPHYLFAQHFGNANRSAFAREHGLGPVPARRIWGINGEDEDHLRQVFDDYCRFVIQKYLG